MRVVQTVFDCMVVSLLFGDSVFFFGVEVLTCLCLSRRLVSCLP